MSKPTVKPKSPYFSSGPCKKRPGWSASKFDLETLGRSHRAKPAKEKLLQVIEQSKKNIKFTNGLQSWNFSWLGYWSGRGCNVEFAWTKWR